MRPIQRFGRLSRRTDKKSSMQESSQDQPKDLSCLYLSIDEATNHVGGTRFRQVSSFHRTARKCLEAKLAAIKRTASGLKETGSDSRP